MWKNRWEARVSLSMVAVLAVATAGDAAAYGAAAWDPPTPKDVPGIPVTNAHPVDPSAQMDSAPVHAARRTAWPVGQATVDLVAVSIDGVRATPKAGWIQAGSLPVKIANIFHGEASSSRRARPGVTKVAVTVHDRAQTGKTGVHGLLLTLLGADEDARVGKMTVEVGYAGFADAFGGDWGTRLRLVSLPACALITPQAPECQTVTALASTNDAKAKTVTADAPITGTQPTVLAVQSAPSGDNGDYTATSLSPAGTWNVGTQTGDFSYSYPMRMPPGIGVMPPPLSLAYSSGNIDGHTSTSNNQGGWIGDGWDMWPGFIERKYASCADDNPSYKTGDQCWLSNNATMSFNGRAGELIETSIPNMWRLKNDDGSRIEKLADPARGNGDNDNEYWKVTTTDGAQYFFGYHKLPNWSSGKPVTESTWTTPVYGNNSGEPCHAGSFATSHCGQAWRWNLDYVVDPHGNTMAYFYNKETGWYGRDLQASQRTAYIRGGWLNRIEYGMRKDAEYSSAAPMRVVFATAERCLSGCWSGPAWTSAPVASAWPDTPWDQDCAAAPCTDKLSPTYWSARRLSKVSTQVRSAATTYRDVESWTLRHEFLNAGDNEGSPMWLRGIKHAGHVTTAGGSAVTEPEITFSPGAEPLPNRVDGPADGRSSLTRFRVKTIITGTGGQINVTYSGPDCTKTTLPRPESNTKRCMPVYYSPAGEPTLDWFHKYVVASVNLHDVQYQDGTGKEVAANEDEITFYDYLDTPAWHYTDDELTPDKYKTWGGWRGYGRVRVRKGVPGSTQTATEYRYMRGMDGDKQPSGVRDVWVPDTWGGSIEDHEAHNGFVRQQITLNGPGGAEVSSTLDDPWRAGPTASRHRNGVTVNAWKTNTGTSRTRTQLFTASGATRGVRTTKTTTAFNADGLPTTVDDFGDEAVDGDEMCTRRTYARNDTLWMIDKVSQEETLSGTCAAAASPAAPSSVLKRSRTFYDSYTGEGSFGAAPSEGDPVRVEELDSWNGSTPVYIAVASNKHDAYGRIIEAADALGDKTTSEYGTDPATGLVTSITVTNPLGHQTVTAKEPAWDLATKVTDPNQSVIEMTYDGMGRRTAVWLPGRDKATKTPNFKFAYLVRNSGGPTAVTTENLLPAGNAYTKSVQLFDGFLRQRQTQMQATRGGRIITETLHNSLGQVSLISGAYYDSTNASVSTTLGSPQGQIPAITQSIYDGAGRVTAEVFTADGAEKSRTTTAYGGDRSYVTPPAGGTATTTITDARGNATAVRHYKTPASVGSDDPATFVQTRYSHTLLGQLETAIDQGGNVWSYEYDLRGRQWRSVDPDKGTISSTYDAAGNLQTTTAQVGSGTGTVAFTYDALGRKTSMRDDTTTGTKRAEWVYDQTPIVPDGSRVAKGKPTSSTRYVSGSAYTTRIDSYDKYARPTSTSVVLPSTQSSLCAAPAPNTCVYTTKMTYAPNGKPHTTTMPAVADLTAEKLVQGYTDVGQDAGMYSASQVYVNTVTYNKLGQLTQRVLGSSAEQSGRQVALTNTYDEPTRRLTGMSVIPELKSEAADYNYTYDNAGNITKISDTPQGQTGDHQCFTYDYLRRLTQAWTPGAGNCATTPAHAGLGGPAPYWHTWELDELGNRKKETRKAAAGDTTYTYSYPAPGAGSVRPHAVANVTAAGAASWTRNYTYDNGGNTKTRPTTAGITQTLTYDKEGHLDTLAQGSATTKHIYDADGNRLIRTDPDGSKTLYLANTEVRAVGTVKTAKRYYTHAGITIGMRTAAGLYWIAGDHHGTAEVTLKANDLAVVAKRRTLPYGEQRGTTAGTWAPGMDKGFVGGTSDPTGLTHLGAREYDPFTGRFLSVDPMLNENDPQSMNNYAYAGNSPVTQSDPTGNCIPDDTTGNCIPGTHARHGGGSSGGTGDTWNRPPTRTTTPLSPLEAKYAVWEAVGRPWACFGGKDANGGIASNCDSVQAWLPQVVQYASEAGVDPELLYAIMGIEVNLTQDCIACQNLLDFGSWALDNLGVYGSLKSLTGRGDTPPSLGWMNIKADTFYATVNEHPTELAGIAWTDLMGDPEISIKVAAYRLADLGRYADQTATPLMKQQFTRNQVIAAMYNTYPQGYEDGVATHGTLGPRGSTYAATAGRWMSQGNTLICHSGVWSCS